jgi:hypothetical protein
LFKKTKGSEAKLAYQGHVLMEHRHGLAANATLTTASGTAEREAALALLGRRGRRRTLAVKNMRATRRALLRTFKTSVGVGGLDVQVRHRRLHPGENQKSDGGHLKLNGEESAVA